MRKYASVQTGTSPLADVPHPRGLWYLAFSEAWERFSYYGMQTLLVLYMARHLFLQNRSDAIIGFEGFQGILESVYGPLTPVALASAVFGLYTGVVYLTPVIGGLLADRVLGRQKTIITGAVLMIVGHFLMAFEAPFLFALAFIAAGTGCFKGNIASQLGSLYEEDDPKRSRAFQIFYLGISLGAVAAPLICGTLGEIYGWHYGFGAAGIGMTVGLAVYLAGRRVLPKETNVRARQVHSAMNANERMRMAWLLVMLPILGLLVLPNQQIFNAYLLWGETQYDFRVGSLTVPTTWLISLDATASIVFLALTVVGWKQWGRHFQEPDEMGKLIFSGLVTMGAFSVLAIAAVLHPRGGIGLGWAVLFHCLNSIAFANMVPVGLSLFTRAAPAAFGATIIGIYYLHLFAANTAVGWLGGYIERMSATSFWLIHIGIAGAGTVAVVLVRRLAGANLGDWEKAAPAAQLSVEG